MTIPPITAPEPVRRRLALVADGAATVSLTARIPCPIERIERGRFEATARRCIDRFDALRLRIEQVRGVPAPFISMGDRPSIQCVWDDGCVQTPPSPLDGTEAANRVDINLRSRSPESAAIALRLPAHCADRQSLEILIAHLAAAASGAIDIEGDEAVSYMSVAKWLQHLSQSAEGSRGRLYWRRLMHDDSLRAGPIRRSSFPTAASVELPIPSGYEQLPSDLREAAAALAWLHLARVMTGNPHLAIGCLSDGRLDQELRSAVGPLSRFIPLILPDDRAGAGALIPKVGARLAEGRQWQELFALEDFTGGRSTQDYFPYCLEYVHQPRFASLAPELEAGDADADRYLVLLRCEERRDGLHVTVRSRDAARDSRELALFVERWFDLVRRSLEHPGARVGDLGVLTSSERQALPWRGRSLRVDGTVHGALSRACRRYGDRVAISARGQELSFAALESLASGVAALLPRVRPETVIGLHADRSPELFVAIFAILEMGAAFLPLSVAAPPARRNELLRQAGVTLVLTDRPWAGDDGRHDVIDLRAAVAAARERTWTWTPKPVAPDQLAYVLYTSGSTGAPAAAAISHRSVLNLWHGLNEAVPELRSPRRIGMNGPMSFDTSIKQLVQLLSGHTIVLIPGETRIDPPAFWTHAAAEQMELVDATPSHLTRLIDPDAVRHRRGLPATVLIGGESLTDRLCTALPFERAYNVYGLTECAVDSLVGAVNPTAPDTLGEPICNTSVSLADSRGCPVPSGVEGELVIGGAGLARGYFRAPRATADRFVPSPFGEGARSFRTGDVMVRSGDGLLHYRDRRGGFVKVAGRRVSLKEVRLALEAQPGVAAAVVATRATRSGAERLVAWVAAGAHAPIVDGFVRYTHEGLSVAGLNRHETAFLYGEVFGRRAYLRHGLSVPDGACVFDVGANIGLFSLQAHLVSRGVRIFAFEPNPDAFRCLLANVRIFGLSGHFLPLAVGRRKEDAELASYAGFSLLSGFYADRNADLAVVREYIRRQHGERDVDDRLVDDLLADRFETRRHRIAVTTISDVMREYQVERVDFLKINVEKSEADVLEGVAPADWPKLQRIALEVHDLDGRLDAIVARLEERGFAVTVEKDWSLPGAASVNHYVYASRGPLPVLDRDSSTAVDRVAPLLTERQLKQALAERLEPQEIPASIRILERLPLTEQGKVDQAALDALPAEPFSSEPSQPAATELEHRLLAEWQAVLDRRDVGVDANFFEAGGDSFSIMQLNLRLRRLLHVELPVVDMFKYPNVRALAGRVSELTCQPS